jgi:hypothetical protein
MVAKRILEKSKMSFKRNWIWGAALSALVAGCGGGSGTAQPTALTGRVIDGYIGGATVCLDVNSNLRCDAGEPTATSAADGSYALTYDGSVDGMQILAVVAPGAIDSELGPITKAFDLLAPAENASVVTPLTTLVSNEMSNRGINAADAEQAIKAQFNFEGDLLGRDFIAANDTETLKVAQVVAASMAAVKEELQTVANGDASVAALSQKDMINAVIAEVKATVLPAVLTADGKAGVSTANLTQEALSASIKVAADVQNVLSGRVEQIVARSKAGDGTVLNMADVFKSGVVIAELASGDYINAQGQRVGNYSGFRDELVAEWLQFDISNAVAPPLYRKVYLPDVDNRWYTQWEESDLERSHYFVNGSWFIGTSELGQTQPYFVDNCVVVPFKDGVQAGTRFCAVSRDMSGKRMGDFLSNVGINAVFPAGSVGYDLTFSSTDDTYEIWGDTEWEGYRYEGNAPTISGFIQATRTQPQWTGDNCSVGFRFSSYDSTTKTGVMEWAPNTSNTGCDNATASFANAETTRFSVINVGGRDVLRATYSNVYRQKNPGDGASGQMVFAVVTNLNDELAVFSGEYRPAGLSTTMPFTGRVDASFQVVNKTLFDAAMSVLGFAAFPYPGRS